MRNIGGRVTPAALRSWGLLGLVGAGRSSSGGHLAVLHHTDLFDTGLSPDAVVTNADRLGIDLFDVSPVVLSHGHFQHAQAWPDKLAGAGPRPCRWWYTLESGPPSPSSPRLRTQHAPESVSVQPTWEPDRLVLGDQALVFARQLDGATQAPARWDQLSREDGAVRPAADCGTPLNVLLGGLQLSGG